MQTYALAISLGQEGLDNFPAGEDATVDRQSGRVIFKNVIDHHPLPAGGLKIVCNPETYELNSNAWFVIRKAAEVRELQTAVAR